MNNYEVFKDQDITTKYQVECLLKYEQVHTMAAIKKKQNILCYIQLRTYQFEVNDIT